MTLTITQATNLKPNSIIPIGNEPKKSRPSCQWYTTANGKLACRWIEED
jgi:hypothetical protein